MQLALFAFIRTIFNTAYRMAYPFLGVFARALGVDLETMSLALTVRSIGGGIIPFIAPLSDSRGRKFGMLLGLGLFTISMGIVVIFPTFPALFASMFFATLAKYIFDGFPHCPQWMDVSFSSSYYLGDCDLRPDHLPDPQRRNERASTWYHPSKFSTRL